jgi:TRAP-type C4-dicarboxylate transport system permease small subunit
VNALTGFDDALYRVEKVVVAVALALMGVVVFLDVVHRVSSREGSLLANPVVMGIAACLLASAAFHTRGASMPVPKGVATGVGLIVAQHAFVWAMPNGLVWSQTFALALTLWLGTIGASLAAHDRRHLAMDVGSKLWPPAIAGKVAAVGHVVTALFAVLVLYLAGLSTYDHFHLWYTNDFASGNLPGTAIPKWFAALAIPYGMVVIAFRFLLDAVRAWTGQLEEDDDPLHQLGIEVEEAAK